MRRVTGPFEVTRTAEPPYDEGPGAILARSRFDKLFSGALDAKGTVQMLSAMTETKGSAGYVALERVVGTLEGKAGTFVLQHSGTMNRGEASLSVTVVPDSATGALAGLSGAMQIEMSGGEHAYVFEYELPEAE